MFCSSSRAILLPDDAPGFWMKRERVNEFQNLGDRVMADSLTEIKDWRKHGGSGGIAEEETKWTQETPSIC
jgi:hypothetical protein